METLRNNGISVEQFLEWAGQQDKRYELVNGQIHRMAGATNGYTDIRNNVEYALTTLSRPKGCRTTGSDSGVRTGARSFRLPDIVVNGGPRDANAREIQAPSIVVEISSPGTWPTNLGAKLNKYQGLSSLQVIIQIEPDVVAVAVHRRTAAGGRLLFTRISRQEYLCRSWMEPLHSSKSISRWRSVRVQTFQLVPSNYLRP